jgi:hypothetical protein
MVTDDVLRYLRNEPPMHIWNPEALKGGKGSG